MFRVRADQVARLAVAPSAGRVVREVKTALNPVEAVMQPIDANAEMRIRLGQGRDFPAQSGKPKLHRAHAAFHLAHILPERPDIAPDRPQHLHNQIVSAAAHAHQDAPGRASTASATASPLPACMGDALGTLDRRQQRLAAALALMPGIALAGGWDVFGRTAAIRAASAARASAGCRR